MTLEEATDVASRLEKLSEFINKSVKGEVLTKFFDSVKKNESKFPDKSSLQLGQALMDHRLLHHVSDSEEFSLTGEYRLISQETPQIRSYHAAVSELIKNAVFTGKVEVQTHHLFGLWNRYELQFGVLSRDKLRLYQRESAASAPLAEFDVSEMSQVKECVNCKEDWYCFTISMKHGYHVTICADHSKRQEGWMSSLTSLGVSYTPTFDDGTNPDELDKTSSIFQLSARRLNSKEIVPFSHFNGNVCLVVNVSTLCGLTPQYAELQLLFEKYKDRGLRIIAFPVNQFANQEPGTEAEIETFARTKFGVTFDMFEKTNCNGKSAHPVFRFVKGKLGGVLGSSVKWNFTKFLCNKDGVPVRRYAPTTKPLSFEDDIVELL